MKSQMTLDRGSLLDSRVEESLEIIGRAYEKAGVMPLIVNFSGGKDSTVLLHLTQKVTDRLLCWYMVSGLEFDESISFVERSCERWKRKLHFSYPADYITKKYPNNNFWIRLKSFGYFPRPRLTWCSIYLKIRPEVKRLQKLYGKVRFFKLNGVRRKESSRRMRIYRDHAKKGFIVPDSEDRRSRLVFPLLNWTAEDVKGYIAREKIELDTNPLYEKFGVSGCSWCAFYGAKIYRRVLNERPNCYDRFIEWEQKINRPSVLGNVWMRDLKEQVWGDVYDE